MADKKRILALNHDIGSVLAMIPALKVLGHEFEIIPIARPESPAFGAFKQAGFDPMWDFPINTLDEVCRELQPALIVVGLSTTQQGPETVMLGLKAEHALEKSIPIAFIYETWPHGWMDRTEKVELYKTADRVLVFDNFSRDEFVRKGFRPAEVVVTGNPANDDLAAMAARSWEISQETRRKLGVREFETVLLYCTTNQDAPECNGKDASHPRFLGFTESQVMQLIFTFTAMAQMRDLSRGSLPCTLWVRLHPAQSREEVENLIKLTGAKATIIGKEWPDGRPLLLAADVVFGTVTMMLQLAAFLGRPAYSCLPNLIKEDTIFSNHLGITVPLYREEIIAGTVLVSPYVPSIVRKGQSGYKLVPKATEKVCQALREMIV